MTPEEIRQTLFRTLDKLDELYGDRTNAEELLRSEREAHRQEVNNLNAAMSAKDKKIAEKDARIAALEKELAQSKASNVDANHKVESANQEKFCGTSKRGIDKKHNTRKGRDDDRDDFDGTAGSAVPQENAPSQSSNDVEAI